MNIDGNNASVAELKAKVRDLERQTQDAASRQHKSDSRYS